MKKVVSIAAAVFALMACNTANHQSQLAQAPKGAAPTPTATPTPEQAPEAERVEIQFGTYTLYDNSEYDPNGRACGISVQMDIINGPTGGSLRLMNSAYGPCRIAINPDPREYKLVAVEEAGCGSKLFRGVRLDNESHAIELTDHRTRICRDLVPHVLEMKEKAATDQDWYTLSVRNLDIDPPQMICMAYWTGFDIDPATNSCVERGTSGCSNPFRFQSEDSCKEFFRL